MSKAKPTIMAKIPVHSLRLLIESARQYTGLCNAPKDPSVSKYIRAMSTAERAIKLAQLRKGIFK